MKNASVASMITVSEETRRMQDIDEDVQHGRHGYECIWLQQERLLY